MAKIPVKLVGLLLVFRSFSAGEKLDRSFNGAVRIREHFFFTDTPLLSKRTSNVLGCTHACLTHTLCISIAFCEHGSQRSGQCSLFNKGIRAEQTAGNSPLVEKKGCTFYQFADVVEGCSRFNCQNGGSCYHDNEYGGFKCACVGDYEGNFCETITYHFTNLLSTGRSGPTSHSSYTGTTLDGKVSLLNGKQLWSAPFTGQYYFDIKGASGGNAKWRKGGGGARVSGYVSLRKSTRLVIVVGQQGVSGDTVKGGEGGGGGGASFVINISDDTLLGAAGGGGGGGGRFSHKNGQGGKATQDGGLYGGIKGLGGASCSKSDYPVPGGGGGYTSNGRCFKGPTCNITMECEAGGGSSNNSFLGGKGDCDGGFGGGGAGNGTSPGGGGGYSGGGVNAIPEKGFAEGGGSYVYDNSWKAVNDSNTGHGAVTVTFHG